MKKLFRSPVMTGLMFVLAVVLLCVGGIGGTQAALQRESAIYRTEMQLRNIGVHLEESTTLDGSGNPTAWKDISWRYYGTKEADGAWVEHTGDLIQTMVENANDTEIKIGKIYPFYLRVENPAGDYNPNDPDSRQPIDEYVRVTLYKYWVKSDETGDNYGWITGNGTKQTNLDPSLIEIIPSNNSGWTIYDETPERMVFYYSGILGVGDTTTPLTTGLRILPGVADAVTTEDVTTTYGTTTKTVTKYTYVFDGVKFVVEAQVDAVQAKHSGNSVPSAWGTAYIG